MPSKKPQLVNDEIYHVIIRGVGDTAVFQDVDDYYRGIFSIYEFNNVNPVSIMRRRRDRKSEKNKDSVRGLTSYTDTRHKFVEILAFCFMPNHIHLLLRQSRERGISQFMKKVGGGYATYFNRKYERKGHLFNNFKSVHIETDDQLKNVVTYIHTNPLALLDPGFKEKGIKNVEKSRAFLENYKWSSFQDYIDIKNFPSITDREFVLKVVGGAEGCRAEVHNWTTVKKELYGVRPRTN